MMLVNPQTLSFMRQDAAIDRIECSRIVDHMRSAWRAAKMLSEEGNSAEARQLGAVMAAQIEPEIKTFQMLSGLPTDEEIH